MLSSEVAHNRPLPCHTGKSSRCTMSTSPQTKSMLKAMWVFFFLKKSCINTYPPAASPQCCTHSWLAHRSITTESLLSMNSSLSFFFFQECRTEWRSVIVHHCSFWCWLVSLQEEGKVVAGLVSQLLVVSKPAVKQWGQILTVLPRLAAVAH